MIVLPGESLAKYRRPEEPEGDEEQSEEPVAEENESAVDEVFTAVEEVEQVPVPEPAAEAPVEEAEEAEIDLDEAILERVEAAERDEEPEQVMTAGASAGHFLEADDTLPHAVEVESEREVIRLDPAGDLIEEQLLEAGETTAAAQEEVEAEGEAETDDEAEGELEERPHAEGVEDSEAPEPARIPQSLTATLREQGGRYPHRASRRMRRRRGGYEGRGDEKQQGGGRQATAEAPVAATPIGREEQRTAARPDKMPPTVSITDLLKEGQEILVQIAKEPLGQKGARITSHIALPGRYVVYMPTVEHLGVSRKIGTDEERLRLKRILQTHRAGIPGGFIMRTAGEGKSEEEIASDMTYLFNLWLDIRQKAEKRPAPALIHHDLDIVQRILRDQFAENFKAIWVDNEDLYESILHFVQRFQPALVGRVKMYTRPVPIFDAFNISAELEKALRPKVWLRSGGYIVINQTEALVAIDVNTGKYVGKSNRLEDTIVKTNTEAVKEIVRQIRLRDLGGIIVVDFIDMDERKNRQKVMQTLEEAMRADKAPNKILQFNDFGLVAITRKRVKQSLERTLCAPCPYCEGAGYVKSVSTVVGEILQEAQKIVNAVEGKDCMLRVHPEVAKYLKSTDNRYLEELEGILGRPVLVVSDARLHQEKFDLT